MQGKKIVWLSVCLAGFVFAVGCASLGQLGKKTQLYPATLGIDISIDQLRQNAQSYDVYYSGPKYNPSAILFVPPDTSGLELRLDKDWKEVAPGPDLGDLFWKIEMGNPNQVKLWVVVPPDEEMQSAENAMAFIYTKVYASLQTISENTYKLRSIPEQFNPTYHDGSSSFDRGWNY